MSEEPVKMTTTVPLPPVPITVPLTRRSDAARADYFRGRWSAAVESARAARVECDQLRVERDAAHRELERIKGVHAPKAEYLALGEKYHELRVEHERNLRCLRAVEDRANDNAAECDRLRAELAAPKRGPLTPTERIDLWRCIRASIGRELLDETTPPEDDPYRLVNELLTGAKEKP